MANKKEIVKDMKFCQELMDRLVVSAENMGEYWWDNRHTVIQQDIIRLRRELNTLKLKLDFYECRKDV